jgi:hypothetical protein
MSATTMMTAALSAQRTSSSRRSHMSLVSWTRSLRAKPREKRTRSLAVAIAKARRRHPRKPKLLRLLLRHRRLRGREYACRCQPGQTATQGATRTRVAQAPPRHVLRPPVAGDAQTPSLEVPRRPVARLRPHQSRHRRAGASRYPSWTLWRSLCDRGARRDPACVEVVRIRGMRRR